MNTWARCGRSVRRPHRRRPRRERGRTDQREPSSLVGEPHAGAAREREL